MRILWWRKGEEPVRFDFLVDDVVAETLRRIMNYLDHRKLIHPGMRISLRQTKHADNANKKTGRTFAMCWNDDKDRHDVVIHYAKAMRLLPARVIVGVLLHELGHAMTTLVERDAGEEDADLWVVSSLPKWIDYKYVCAEYGKDVANAVEAVSERFVKAVNREANH